MLRRTSRLWRCVCGATFALHTGQPARSGDSCHASQYINTPLHSRWTLIIAVHADGAYFTVVGGFVCLGWVIAEIGFDGFLLDGEYVSLDSAFHPM